MANQFPSRDWYAQPIGWPYWTPDSLPSGGVMSPLRLPWELPSAVSQPAVPFGPDGGILGNVGQPFDDPWTNARTTMGPNGWNLPLPPVLSAPSVPFSFPVPPAMPAAPSRSDRSPVPRPPDLDSGALRVGAESVEPFPQPPGGPARSARGGERDAGPWPRAGGAQDEPEVLSDAAPDNDWLPGADYAGVGHHYAPRQIFKKFPFPPETRKVFERATTGPLPFRGWHEFDDLHRLYSDAVEGLMGNFMKERNLEAERMTPAHAEEVLKAISESKDPRILTYRAMFKFMGKLYRLRTGGRGSE
jgi:hypothetical protein